MANNALHIFLIAVIAACPTWCGLGVCATADGCAASECVSPKCCGHDDCCSQDSQNEQRDGNPGCPPSQPSDSPGCDLCQCVCGGAIVEQDDCELTHREQVSLCDVSVVGDSSADLFQWRFSHSTIPNAGSTDPGCRLCILHLSMLL